MIVYVLPLVASALALAALLLRSLWRRRQRRIELARRIRDYRSYMPPCNAVLHSREPIKLGGKVIVNQNVIEMPKRRGPESGGAA